MKSISATWFETKVRYEKVAEDGMRRKVTETYVVDALSFTEAEARITKEMADYISGAFAITDEKIAAYGDVILTEAAGDDKWYTVKVQQITVSEKTGRKTRTGHYLLVQAADLEKARKTTEDYYRGTMYDYVIASVVETPVMDVYIYGTNGNE